MMKRTTVNLDTELIAEAAATLGTRKTTDTLRRSLEEVVRRKKLQDLTAWDLPGLTLKRLHEERRGRSLPPRK